MGVATEGGGAGGGGAVTLVSELDRDGEGGALGVAGEAVDGVVAGGGVGRVDGGVAKAVALCDDKAAGGTFVEGGGETGDVEPCTVLGGRDELVVDDGGGRQGEVGRGEEEEAGASLGGGDGAPGLSVADGGACVGGVKGVGGVEHVDPAREVHDHSQLLLAKAFCNLADGVESERVEVGQPCRASP